jgi:CubicO group peptidase (beta-lactamase class C family)
MIDGFAGPLRRLVSPPVVLAALSMWVGASTACLAQQAIGRPAPALDVPASSSETLSHLPTFLEEKYPGVRSLVLVRGNCVAFEYYRKDISAETWSPVHSITKSVLSILVGIALDQGYLRLDQKLPEILPEVLEKSIDPRVRDITVRDLLTMTSGFDPAGEYAKIGVPTSERWRWMINRPMTYAPGSHFNYDDTGANLTSVVLKRAIGRNPAQFARQNLFDPMGIKNYNWISDSEGNLIGRSTLSLTARDMAKIGILYLQLGRWGDRQLVSNDYVVDSTTKHNDGGPPVHAAYGYFWWTKKTKTDLDAFFAAGSGSQLIYVVPKLDLVAALAAGPSLPGGSVEFVNDIVLPAATTMPSAPMCIARLGREHPE